MLNGIKPIFSKGSKNVKVSMLKKSVGDIKVTSINIIPNEVNLRIGETIQLRANILPLTATNKEVVWESGNSAYFTVNDIGLVTAVSEGMNTINCYSTDGSNVVSTCIVNVIGENTEPPSIINEMECPYISTYYFNPKPYHDEDAIIPIYITDFNESEYMLDDYSKRFRLRVEVNGNVRYIENLKAGDHDINLGRNGEGEHWFSLQVIDEYGRESHRLYNELWVVNRQTYPITPSQTYTITDADLTRHKVNKNNSQVEQDMINNRVGLTSLFKEVRDNGYRKCILVNGIYRVNRTIRMGTGNETPIDVPSGLTVDFNQSTIKLHPYSDDHYVPTGRTENLMIRLVDCFDTHLINGIIEGDYFERIENSWLYPVNGHDNGEHCNSITTYGGKYNSYENLIIRQTTGYQMTTAFGKTHKVQYFSSWQDNKSINEGELIDKEGFVTSEFKDISFLDGEKFLCLSVWLSAGGVKGNSFIIDIHFYDKDKNHIESIKSMQYRYTRIPNGSKFIRVTAIGVSEQMGGTFPICVHNHPTNRYCYIKNVEAIDNRTCFAPSAFNNMLYENIKFIRTGESITPCCVDLEDGWEQSQDFYMRNCDVVERAPRSTMDYISNANFNSVIENCDNWRIDIRFRCHGNVVRNNTNIRYFKLVAGWPVTGTPFTRVYGNDFKEAQIAYRNVGEGSLNLKIKDNVFNQCTPAIETNYIENAEIVNSVFNKMNTLGCNIKDSTINGFVTWLNATMKINNCKVYKHSDSSYCQVPLNQPDFDKEFRDTTFFDDTVVNGVGFGQCRLINCNFNGTLKLEPSNTATDGKILLENCIFDKSVTINNSKSDAIIRFNNCEFKNGKTISIPGNNNVIFNNCIG